MKTSIKVNREDIKKVVAEEQYVFICAVLRAMNIPSLGDSLPDGNSLEDFTMEYKLKLRQTLTTLGLLIVDDRDGGIEIYMESPPLSGRNELIAKWNKCRFELREDRSTIDPKKRIYAIIYIDYWAQYENN